MPIFPVFSLLHCRLSSFAGKLQVISCSTPALIYAEGLCVIFSQMFMDKHISSVIKTCFLQ